MSEIAAVPAIPESTAFDERLRTANRIFRGALAFNIALTLLWIFTALTHGSYFFKDYRIDREALMRVGFGVLWFNVIWGFIWYGVKRALLRYSVGFSKAEVRAAFSSRMKRDQPFEVAEYTARHSERRIRIADMVGRRGRFITIGAAFFYYLYAQLSADPKPGFATAFLADNLFDAVANGWIFLAFYYSNSFLGAAFYGPQSRVMDGVLARANCLLITTLWAGFKFIMLPLGTRLAAVYPPRAFAAVFAMIWGSYMACDAMAEVGGALFGKQKIKVSGVGDVNRKSIAGTLTGFAASLALCVAVVLANHFPAPWLGLAVVISLSNTVLELYSPRGTDDFTMTLSNALICLAFGLWIR